MSQGDVLAFSASLNGSYDATVQWAVVEGTAGGIVDAQGTYKAPADVVGTFHLKATDVPTGASATATISVVKRPSITQFYVDPMVRKEGDPASLVIQCTDGTPTVTYIAPGASSTTVVPLPAPINGIIKTPVPTSNSTYFYLVVRNQANATVQKGAGAYVDTPVAGIALPNEPFLLASGEAAWPTQAPKVAINDIGQASLLWTKKDSQGATSLCASFFDPSKGWSAPTTLRASYSQFSSFDGWFRVEKTSGGQFLAAWSELRTPGDSSATDTQVVYAVFSSVTGWSVATPVPVSNVFDFRMVGDPSGVLTFAFETVEAGPSMPATHRIRAIQYDSATGWSASRLLDTASATLSGCQIGDLVLSNTGQCWLSWTEHYETLLNIPGMPARSSILVSGSAQGGSWDPAVAVSDDSMFHLPLGTPQLAVDGQGNLLLARVASIVDTTNPTGFRTDVHVNTFHPPTGWGTESILFDTTASSPLGSNRWLVGNNSGQTALVWAKPVGGGLATYAKYYDPTSGWGASTALQFAGNRTVANSMSPGALSLGIDDLGEVTTVWNESRGGYPDTFLSVRPISGAWTSPAIISQPLFGSGSGMVGTSLDIVMAENGAGRAVFIWRQDDGTGRTTIWNTYRGQ